MALSKLKILRFKIFAAFLLLGIIVSGIIATVLISQQERAEPASLAAGGACSGGEDDFQGCTNGGSLQNGCNWICNDAPPGTVLVPPPCCETLAQTGDPFECCFDARRRCTPQQCSAIPAGVVKQRCGQLWELGYCTSAPNNTPKPTSSVQATNTPKPTKKPKPTNQPTTIPKTTPRLSPVPTQGGINPSEQPVNSPEPTAEDDFSPTIVDEINISPTLTPVAGPSPLVFIGTYIQNFWNTIVDFTHTVAP